MPTADVNGIRLHYELAGEGPRLLFLNGSGATLASTQLLLDPFRKRFELLAHDQQRLLGKPIQRADRFPGRLVIARQEGQALPRLEIRARELAQWLPARTERGPNAR